MKKAYRRLMSVMLIFTLVLAIPFAFTQEASAASKKTKYVITKETHQYTEDGKKKTDVTTYTYNKKGLCTSVRYGKTKIKYTRNKKGYISTEKMYTTKGKLLRTYTYSYKYNKKGLATREKKYLLTTTRKGKKKELKFDTDFTYHKNKRVKSANITNRESYSYEFIRYDKKKGMTYDQVFWDDDEYFKETHKLTYDKTGHVIKDVATNNYYLESDVFTTVTTKTYKNTYDKHKNVKKSIVTITVKDSDGDTSTSKEVYTYKYKKVKVPKKYLKFF